LVLKENFPEQEQNPQPVAVPVQDLREILLRPTAGPSHQNHRVQRHSLGPLDYHPKPQIVPARVVGILHLCEVMEPALHLHSEFYWSGQALFFLISVWIFPPFSRKHPVRQLLPSPNPAAADLLVHHCLGLQQALVQVCQSFWIAGVADPHLSEEPEVGVVRDPWVSPLLLPLPYSFQLSNLESPHASSLQAQLFLPQPTVVNKLRERERFYCYNVRTRFPHLLHLGYHQRTAYHYNAHIHA
jgi:hypothetical protein